MPEDPLVPNTAAHTTARRTDRTRLPPPAAGPTSTGMAQNVAAGVAVLFTFVSGIVFLVIEKRSQYVRFWAMQATIYGLIWVAARILFAIVVSMFTMSIENLGVFRLIGSLWTLLRGVPDRLGHHAVFAFTGKEWELPVLGKFARQQLVKFSSAAGLRNRPPGRNSQSGQTTARGRVVRSPVVCGIDGNISVSAGMIRCQPSCHGPAHQKRRDRHSSQRYVADILCEGETISRIDRGLSAPSGAEVIDATGKYVFPGFIDPHTHVYLPFMGTFAKDDYETASRAALIGGTTTIFDMCCPARDTDPAEGFRIWTEQAPAAPPATIRFTWA